MSLILIHFASKIERVPESDISVLLYSPVYVVSRGLLKMELEELCELL